MLFLFLYAVGQFYLFASVYLCFKEECQVMIVVVTVSCLKDLRINLI